MKDQATVRDYKYSLTISKPYGFITLVSNLEKSLIYRVISGEETLEDEEFLKSMEKIIVLQAYDFEEPCATMICVDPEELQYGSTVWAFSRLVNHKIAPSFEDVVEPKFWEGE